MTSRVVKSSAKEAAFGVTCFFETGGRYGVVTGDFDGQILSVGALQWNVGQGTLFPLIIRSWEENPQAFEEIFGQQYQLVLRAAREKDKEAFRQMVNQQTVLAHWREKWVRWAETFAGIQRTVGAEPYYRRAQNIVETFDLKTSRAYAWAFDLAVQNGGMGRATARAREELNRFRPTDEREILRRLTSIREDLVIERWRKNYRLRKNAIIAGRVTIGQRVINLDLRFGLDDEPWWAEE